jgi:PAS domain S-box-containing protein
MFGYTAGEMIGKPASILTPADRNDDVTVTDRTLRTGDSALHTETIRLGKGGKNVDVNVAISPIKDEAGRTIGASAMYHDITARRQAEESLRQLSRLLLRLEEQERRRVAHDLQNSISPVLTSLIGKLYGLKKRALDLDTGSAHLLEESLTLAEHASSLTVGVSSVLHPPLLESHGLPASLRWYLDNYSKRAGVRIETDLQLDLPPIDEGKAMALFRVVQDSLIRLIPRSATAVVTVRLYGGRQQLCLEITSREPQASRSVPRIEDGASDSTIPVLRYRLAQFGGQLDIKSEDGRIMIGAAVPVSKDASAGLPTARAMAAGSRA